MAKCISWLSDRRILLIFLVRLGSFWFLTVEGGSSTLHHGAFLFVQWAALTAGATQRATAPLAQRSLRAAHDAAAAQAGRLLGIRLQREPSHKGSRCTGH